MRCCNAKLLFLLIKPQVIRKYFFEFKSQCRFLRRSLHVVQVLSVPLCCTTKTSSRWRSLRMTYGRGVCTLHFAFSGCTECPPTSLCEHSNSLPQRVAKRREGLKKQHSVLFFPERDRARRRDKVDCEARRMRCSNTKLLLF